MKRIIVPTTTTIHSDIQEHGVFGKEINKQLHGLAAAASALSKVIVGRNVKVVRYPIDSELWLHMFKIGGNHETMEVYKSLCRDDQPTNYIRGCMETMLVNVLRVPIQNRAEFLKQAYKMSYEELVEQEWDFESLPEIVEEYSEEYEFSASEKLRQHIIDRLMHEDEIADALRVYRTDPIDAAKRRLIECILDEADYLNERMENENE